MIRYLWAALLLLVSVSAASAQGSKVNIQCLTNSTPPWDNCSNAFPFPVTLVGGGGGGLSVVDSAPWTTQVSPFTPGGGVFNDAATLSSGQQGTFRMTTKRAQIVDVDPSGNQLHSDLTAPPNLLVNGANGIWSGRTPGTAQTGTTVAADVYPSLITLGSGTTLVSGTTAAMTGTSNTQIVAAVASNRLYITRIKCNNSSATATLVQIRDGSGGTILDTLAAGATYGGEQGTGATPLFWTTAGNALFAQNVTTSASVICTASGYSGI